MTHTFINSTNPPPGCALYLVLVVHRVHGKDIQNMLKIYACSKQHATLLAKRYCCEHSAFGFVERITAQLALDYFSPS